MVYLSFLVSAVIVVVAAVYLNTFGDVISRKSSLSGAVVGTFLIAGATSLPELTTSLTAVYIDNTDIAVGNMLGSNVFNLLIIAVMDIFYRRRKLYHHVDVRENLSTAIVGLLFAGIIVLALLIPGSYTVFNIGVEMIVIVLLYIMYVRFTSSQSGEKEVEQEEDVLEKDYSKRTAIIGFIIAALVVFIAGSVLSISGDQLAKISGLNASFVGNFLIAAATSLPELVAVMAAIKMFNYSIALGSILGSNLFNLQILAITDALYREDAILKDVDVTNSYTAILGMVMTLFVIYNLLRKKEIDHVWRYALPSIIVTAMYFVVSFLMF
ncbi:sodium:calcium antiporter [Pontibacillus litoralis]|uniref:Sodium:calcium antiporter n=1 Tax=Pontibacillus litoralis JSM 072002 TaxID=1385512 RepID=A0A0A5G370_9BACI|nr:sodium:calcium antiporter [Pontibacillus litoralis]KGX85578.1 sodium:calcium antiporter [Pontibacillus litoralis JSM 072002]